LLLQRCVVLKKGLALQPALLLSMKVLTSWMQLLLPLVVLLVCLGTERSRAQPAAVLVVLLLAMMLILLLLCVLMRPCLMLTQLLRPLPLLLSLLRRVAACLLLHQALLHCAWPVWHQAGHCMGAA
jgi:TRAP-type uncharacterized transport system fused permease subunit